MKDTILLFPSKLHQIRDEKNLYQKDLADALSIDTPTYCRIEKGERRAKREQVITLATFLKTDEEELLTLWLADQVSTILSTEKQIANRVLNVATQCIK